MNRIVVYKRAQGILSAFGNDMPCSCEVRTAENGLRPLHDKTQVHYSMNADGSQGKPCMPSVFPLGTFNPIPGMEVMRKADPTTDLGPVVVSTDAHQTLKVWALDADGGYDHETEETVDDWGYEFHFCDPLKYGIYSVGCCHLGRVVDMMWYADQIEQYLQEGDTLQYEVI